jgi:hypothetical protein
MRTLTYCIFSLIFWSFNKYIRHQKTLPDLIIHSDCIVIGQIKNLTDTNLTIKTVACLKGDSVPVFLLSKKQNSSHNTRQINKNASGQYLLLFLTKGNGFNKYELYTDHGEAEYVVKDSVIYVYSRTWYMKSNREKYPNTFITVDNISIDASVYNKLEMSIAIKDYLKDAKTLVKKLRKEPDIKYILNYKSPQKEEVVIKDEYILKFINKSKSHKRLIDELTDEPNGNLQTAE